MKQLSKNLWDYETDCNCGCGLMNITAPMVETFQTIRDKTGTALICISVSRCAAKNKSAGGASNSGHFAGEGMDIYSDTLTQKELGKLIYTLWRAGKLPWLTYCYPIKRKDGSYADTVHIGTDKKNRSKVFAFPPEWIAEWETDDYFPRCQKHVGVSEGGANFDIVNGVPVIKPASKNDRGGLTIYGITEGTLRSAYSKGLIKHQNIAKLTKDEAYQIYKAMYWLPSKSDKMSWGLCLVHYDCAVNCGIAGAGKQLQRAINNLSDKKIVVDGIVGTKTLEMTIRWGKELVPEYLSVREAFYRGLVEKDAGQAVFLKGWLNRLERVRKEALS